MTPGPYGSTALDYYDAGWSPIHVGQEKGDLPKGYLGAWPTRDVIESRAKTFAGRNVGIRMPDDVLGIDVDHYDGKTGGDDLERLEAELGPLPQTVSSTSRGEGPSRIRFFRVPGGRHWKSKLSPAIEVIRHRHRFALVSPSIHPRTGDEYRWYGPDGHPLTVDQTTGEPLTIPDARTLPELPEAWQEHLASVAPETDPGLPDDRRTWLQACRPGPMCHRVESALQKRLEQLSGILAIGSRYETMVPGVWEMLKLGKEGHAGIAGALQEIRTQYVEQVGADRSDPAGEFNRALAQGTDKNSGHPPADSCDCQPAEVAARGDSEIDELVRKEYRRLVSIKEAQRLFDQEDGGLKYSRADFQPLGSAMAQVHDVDAVWGDSDDVWWASGESLMLFGGPGVGKSTVGQRIALGRIGFGSTVLDLPVLDDGGKLLYLAMDRPAQVLRSFRRMVHEDRHAELDARALIHQGPLPVDISRDVNRGWLMDRAAEHGVTTIVVDSVKDVVPGASNEEAAAGYNHARQAALTNGIQWIEIHHNRKGNAENKKPVGLDDVYGNRYVTAGAGSVFALWGEPPEVEMRAVKIPAGMKPHFGVAIDMAEGQVTRTEIGKSKADQIRTVIMLDFEGRPFTSADIQDALSDIPKGTVGAQLSRMVSKGEIQKDGSQYRVSKG